MRWPAISALGCAICASLSSCDIGQFTQTKNTTEFVVSMTHQPHPPLAGQPTKIFLTLRQERQGVSGCRARLNVEPFAAADVAAEPAWYDLTEQSRSGVYTIKEKLFPAAGEWRVNLNINCTGIDRKLDFPVTVGSSQ